jgi:hypothetical protein
VSIEFLLNCIVTDITSSDAGDMADIELLRELIAEIRPKKANDFAFATDRLHVLCYLLTSQHRNHVMQWHCGVICLT